MFIDLQKKFPNRFKLVLYNDLLQNTITLTTKLFQFLDLPLTTQTLNYLTKSRNTNIINPYSVYKKKNHDDYWKKSLDPKIIKSISIELKKFNLSMFYQND